MNLSECHPIPSHIADQDETWVDQAGARRRAHDLDGPIGKQPRRAWRIRMGRRTAPAERLRHGTVGPRTAHEWLNDNAVCVTPDQEEALWSKVEFNCPFIFFFVRP
jgi:hypothetical protein